jgi:hypothetical protein
MGYPNWGNAQGPVKCCKCKQLITPGSDIWIKSKGVYYCMMCGHDAEEAGTAVMVGGIEEALLRDLEEFDSGAADTSLAKQALYMARQLDGGEVAPREVTQYTKEIRLNLLQLRELYPPADENDDTESRAQRLAERRRREQGGI